MTTLPSITQEYTVLPHFLLPPRQQEDADHASGKRQNLRAVAHNGYEHGPKSNSGIVPTQEPPAPR
jgi:hypothetical protein